MANPSISLLGATYSDVSGVSLPKQGGGTATFPYVEGSQTITTNNTYDVTNLAQVVVNVSGGGGASNIVTGTFTGTTTGAAMDVTLNYTGSGYPVAAIIYPSNGLTGNSAFNNLIQRYAIVQFTISKLNMSSTPTYSSTSNSSNKALVTNVYKSSATSSTSTSRTSADNVATYSTNDATDSNTLSVRFQNSKKMSVFIANTSYGFAANIEYTYYVIYSS